MRFPSVLCALVLLLCSSPHADAGRALTASSGRYELGRRVGRGGFGTVYKGWKLITDRSGKTVRGQAVAIKQYHSLAGAIEEDEVRKALGRVPNLPQGLGDGYDERTRKTFLVSRWTDGRTLGQWSDGKPRTIVDKVRSVVRASKVVAGLHERGWLHLDLKPDNIMIDRKQHVSLIDIGTALKKDVAGRSTSPGTGTPGYMAPEQSTRGTVDDRTDVFALAATLYHLVANEVPVTATGIGEHLDRIADPALRAIVGEGLSADPASRHSGARAFAAALARWERQQPAAGQLPSARRTIRGVAR